MMRQEDSRIFYFCSINSKSYEQNVGHKLHIGAATNKVLSIISALRYNMCKAYSVSLPVLGYNSNHKKFSSKVLHENNIPMIFLPVYSHPLLRRLHGIFIFAFFCLRHVRHQDKVIIYNYVPEYILSLLILRLKGNPALIDIEDAPLPTNKNLKELINKITFKITKILCQKRYITVSEQIAKNLKLFSYCVIYGASKQFLPTKKINTSYRFIYGGTLCHDTGLDLFCEALKYLFYHKPTNNLPVEFIVTGFGGESQIESLQNALKGTYISIEINHNITPTQYQKILRSCHAGLALKLPNTEVGSTTFPSKIIEITSSGLLLISTSTSDVPLIFSDKNTAIIIEETTAKNLGDNLIWVIENIDYSISISDRGNKLAAKLFSEQLIGEKIKQFIFKEN